MYHAIIRRKVAQTFAALGRGEYEVAIAGIAQRFEHDLPEPTRSAAPVIPPSASACSWSGFTA